VQHVLALPGVRVVKGPMCRWGMKATDRNGRIGYVKKETGWMTNSPELADALEGYCECMSESGEVPYRHVHLVGGLAAAAATYPPKLVKAILEWFFERIYEGEKSSPTSRRSVQGLARTRWRPTRPPTGTMSEAAC
jgi:hypothetical protein